MIDSAWLRARQNDDGGWGYTAKDASAVEPTALALLALEAAGDPPSASMARASAWIAGLQRSDGGWPPRPAVSYSTWVTGLVLLLPPPVLPDSRRSAGIGWLSSQTGRESSLLERFRNLLIGSGPGVDVSNAGWPWFPGAAAWTVPTAIAVLALRRVQASGSPSASASVQARIDTGQRFLLARRCADGGWNHGANQALGYQSSSYPETTGVALLALAGVSPGQLGHSLEAAEKHLQATRSREGAAWLQLGLQAHGRRLEAPAFSRNPATTLEYAVAVLAAAAREGRKVLPV